MSRSLTPKIIFGLPATSIFLFQFLLPWLTLCSRQPSATVDANGIQLTRKSLNSFTAYLTGGSTDPRSVRLPAAISAEKSDWKLWAKYVIGSVAVLGSVDRCALSIIYGLRIDSRSYYLPRLLEELAKKNDLDTAAHFIAKSTGERDWDTCFGNFFVMLVKSYWRAMRQLARKVLAILKESKNKGKEYGAMVRRMPVGFQYGRISSGTVPLDEIGKVYPLDRPFHSLLREIFFRARCSRDPSPQIREYIAERAPWFRQFMPCIPRKAKDTRVISIVEPGHDVWARIRSFMDAETLIFVWPLVCQTWNKSYSKILAENIRIQEWFLQDLNHVRWHRIHMIAPWNRFLSGKNSAAYLGQCIINGALGRTKLNHRSYREIRRYLGDAASGKAPIPRTGKGSATHVSFAKLIEEGYKAYPHKAPILLKPSFLTDEEHEEVIRYLVCQQKLAVQLSCKWIIDNIPRIYSILGEDQVLIQEIVSLSADDYREVLFIWIMIGQVCGMTEEIAKLVFDGPGIFTQRLIRPVVVKPSEYYDYIADSGMLFEMINIYRREIERGRIRLATRRTYEFHYFVISLVLFFKDRSDKIEKIVVSMVSQLPTVREELLESIKDWFGTETVWVLTSNGEHPPEDVEFVREVLTRCGLLSRVTV